MLLQTLRHILSHKFGSASSDLIAATQTALALYLFVTGRRLLTTGLVFPCTLKDADTHFAVLSRWHAELQISVLDVGLTEVEHGLLHEVASDGREGTVCSHDQVSTLLYSFVSDRPVRDGKFSVNANIYLSVRLNIRFM